MEESNQVLSERELEILRLVATGAANKQIANQLIISPNTVKVHLRNIFAKIGVSSRTEATLYAMNIGLVKTAASRDISTGNIALPEEKGEEIAGDDGSRQASQPLRSGKSLQLGLAILAALLLTVAAFAVYQRLNSALPAASQATLAALTGSRWSDKANLPDPRMGMGGVEYENDFYIIAGQTSQGIDGTTLRYRLNDGSWTTLASKPTAVSNVQAALVGEKIYVPGGCLADGRATPILEVFDPRQNVWEKKASLPKPVCAYALASYEGRLYLFGGQRDGEFLSEIYIYDPGEDRWQERKPLSTPRAYAGAVVLPGKILIIGGYDGQQAASLNEAYFPNRETAGENAWESYAPLPEGRYAMGITQLAGLIYVLGGKNSAGDPPNPQALQYLPQSDQWEVFEAYPQPAGAFPIVLASGNFLHVLGGEGPSGISPAHQSYQAIYTISVPYISGNE